MPRTATFLPFTGVHLTFMSVERHLTQANLLWN